MAETEQGARRVSELRSVGKAEGVSYLLLLGVAMPLKYWGDLPIAVKVTGWVHGGLFVLLLVVLLRAHFSGKLPWRLSAWVLVASLLPFGPFVVDRWLQPFAHPNRA